MPNIEYEKSHQIAQQIEYTFYSKKEEEELQSKIDIIDVKLTKEFLNTNVNIPLNLDTTPYIEYKEDYDRLLELKSIIYNSKKIILDN